MASTADRPSKRLRLRRALTAAILVAGFASAVVVYVFARPPADNPFGYDPLETKSYVHDLELYGGKWSVHAEEFRNWFADLWQGRNLAFTIATLTVLLVLVVRFVTASAPELPVSDTDWPEPARPRPLRVVESPARSRTPRR